MGLLIHLEMRYRAGKLAMPEINELSKLGENPIEGFALVVRDDKTEEVLATVEANPNRGLDPDLKYVIEIKGQRDHVRVVSSQPQEIEVE